MLFSAKEATPLMKKLPRLVLSLLFFAVTLFIPSKAQAKVDPEGLQQASKNLVLQHAKDISNTKAQKYNLSWHESHYSHASHASHASHESHASHYSSIY